MKSKLSILLIVVSFFFIRICPAVSQQIIFNKVPPPDGETLKFVTGITQDDNGIMWFSTKNGLVRYDGNQMTSFKNDPLNLNSVMSNALESVCADDDGSLWIGSLGQGLDHFDPVTGTFTHYQHDPKNKESLGNDTVTAILQDKQGIVWIGTHGGLDRFDPETNAFSHYRHNNTDQTSLSNNQVRSLYADSEGTLWIGTGSPYASDGGGPEDGGLNCMNKNSGTFTRYLHDPQNSNSLVNNKVSALYEDSKGVFWVGTAKNRLHIMNRKQGTFERIVFDPAHPEKLSIQAGYDESVSYDHISFITQDAAGNYWIGTSNSGLNYYNPMEAKNVLYNGDTNPSAGFTDNGAWKAFSSRDGILWFGCPDPGGSIYHVNPLQRNITNTVVSTAPVNSFFEEADGTFWLGTNHDLIRIDQKNGITKRYDKELNPSKSAYNNIFFISDDRQGNLWVGSSYGLVMFDKTTEKFTYLKHETKNEKSLSNNNVTDILEDSRNNFWITTFCGLNLMDRKTGTFTRFFINPADTTTYGANVMAAVYEDKSGKLWIGGWNGSGMNVFNPETKTFKNYLKGSGIMCILEDSDGVIWAGGNNGFYKYDPKIDNFTSFGDSYSLNGLPDVYNIIEDNQKNLWLGTSDGIVRLNPQRNETSLFGENYGIAKNTLAWGTAYKGLNGDIYFGNSTGYYKIDPAAFLGNLDPPEIILTGFHLADQAIKTDKNGPLKENLGKVKEIRLKYNQNVFSFDLAIMDYANPQQNRLIYFLENYDKSWIQPNSDRRAYYFNVPPGEYVFHIKGSNGYGVWAEKKITVIILPPWWRTWLAYCFYAFLLVAVILGFDRFMRRRIKMAERQRTQERELAQAKEIEKAYTELKATQAQLIQSEKMASLGELTAGIAHEIQNPLNFVNNFSEVSTELVDEMKQELAVGSWQSAAEIADDIKQNLERINHHGKRADAIVKGMLQHSRTSSGQKELTDINALADEYLRLSYHGLRAKDKTFNATMKTDFDETIGKITIVPQDMGRVLLNLINNAFYAVSSRNLSALSNLTGLENKITLEDYKPTVTVSTRKNGTMVEISVKDNGNGIPQKLLDKIFQPFFTTKPSGEGTGLGLSLSYEIVTKGHGGELKVHTIEGEGTEFIIVLPQNSTT